MPYFNAQYLPEPKNEYVCWLDIMGTKSSMSNSIKMSANFIFKLHATILEHQYKDVNLYPIMDGVYLTSASKQSITRLLAEIFKELADLFINEQTPYYKFLVKASLAYGPIIHGNSLPPEANDIFERQSSYRNSLMLGLPMVQAFQSEGQAPPFGVFVHESARAFSPDSEDFFQLRWWQWYRYIPGMSSKQKNDLASNILKNLKDYYAWVEKHAFQLDYKMDRIQVHKEMAIEYFSE